MSYDKTLLGHVAEVVRPGESFLVTLSGGADSVALLSSLVSLGHRCRAVHCNYHLRGDESVRDERHARDVAGRLNVELDVIHCDVDQYRAAHPGQSIEMACREIRYREFERLRAEYSLDSIAVGHHLEDNIETMLLNMLRGSGVKGLAAMRHRRGLYVRPLLLCTKAMILAYLETERIGYVTDSSNLSNDYRRNALRNDIIPAVTCYFPDAVTGMAHTLEALGNQRDLLEDSVNKLANIYIARNGAIDLKKLLSVETHPSAILFELLNRPDYRGYNLDIIDNIIKRSTSSGLTFIGTDGSAYRLDHGFLEPFDEDVDDSGEIEIIPGRADSWKPILEACYIAPADFKPQRDPSTAYFDAGVLKRYNRIILRHPKPGDRMQPWGMKGSRLLSDIFTDMHATSRQRHSTWVLEADGTILWLVGIRASRHASVTSATALILRLHLH